MGSAIAKNARRRNISKLNGYEELSCGCCKNQCFES